MELRRRLSTCLPARRLLPLLAVPLVGSGAAKSPNGVDVDTSCNGDREGLLWRVRHQNATAYLLGTYRMGVEELEPMPGSVSSALECADIAYFQFACSDSDYGAYGSHCTTYPMVGPNDALVLRIPSQDASALLAALKQAAASAPAGCEGAAKRLLSRADAVLTEGNRTTLMALRDLALSALDPVGCLTEQDARGLEEWLRNSFSSSKRPVYGLEDIEAKCQLYRGGTPAEDVELAERLTAELSNPDWLKNYTRLQSEMVQVVRCGDLDAYAALRGFTTDLPWSGGAVLKQRNPALVTAIVNAMGRHPGKVLLLVLSIDHLFNFGGATGLLELLEDAGLAVKRMAQAFTCAKSEHVAMGTKELRQCLVPTGQYQPDSCDIFKSVFDKLLGSDPTHGRTKNSSDCAGCLTANQSCACSITWINDSAYQELCRNTTVEGVHGEVYELDLSRNPGSARYGQAVSEKTVRGIHQNCYATSCNLPLLQEEATRVWYSTDPSLSTGVVTIRVAGGAGAGVGGAVVRPDWVFVAAVAGGASLVILALMACFLMPKRAKQVRSQWQNAHRSSPYEPFKEPESEEDDGSPYSPASKAAGGGGRGGGAMPPQMMQQQAPYQHHVEPLAYQEPFPQRPPPPPPQQMQRGDPYADSLLLQQALQMRQQLDQAGAQAMHQMQLFGVQAANHNMHDSPMQSPMHSMAMPVGNPPFQAGSAFGSSAFPPTSFSFIPESGHPGYAYGHFPAEGTFPCQQPPAWGWRR